MNVLRILTALWLQIPNFLCAACRRRAQRGTVQLSLEQLESLLTLSNYYWTPQFHVDDEFLAGIAGNWMDGRGPGAAPYQFPPGSNDTLIIDSVSDENCVINVAREGVLAANGTFAAIMMLADNDAALVLEKNVVFNGGIENNVPLNIASAIDDGPVRNLVSGTRFE
jgi:hypothetical protein